ncbi:MULTISPECIES: hypothetical protein [Providencia]|nr:hypothetical protein [Providencia stuartii]
MPINISKNLIDFEKMNNEGALLERILTPIRLIKLDDDIDGEAP